MNRECSTCNSFITIRDTDDCIDEIMDYVNLTGQYGDLIFDMIASVDGLSREEVEAIPLEGRMTLINKFRNMYSNPH